MKTINFTNKEIKTLKDILDSYISYILASGEDEEYYEVHVCKSLIEKLNKGE